MDRPLHTYTARELEIEQVRRAYARGVQTLADARATVVALEARQAARLAEIERQLALHRVDLARRAPVANPPFVGSEETKI